MILRYQKKDGTQVEFILGDRPINIGRSPEADLVILDEKASRVHCGIRVWDGDFFLKDLKSRNGTFVNDQKVEIAKLNPGDRIRIGRFQFQFEADSTKGNQTVLRELAEEMTKGKGYTTMMKEIVQDADDVGKAAAAAKEQARAEPTAPPAPPTSCEPSEVVEVVPEAPVVGEATVVEPVAPVTPPPVPSAAGGTRPAATKMGLKPGLKLPPKMGGSAGVPARKFVVKIRKPNTPPETPGK